MLTEDTTYTHSNITRDDTKYVVRETSRTELNRRYRELKERIRKIQNEQDVRQFESDIEATVLADKPSEISFTKNGWFDLLGIKICRLLHKPPVFNNRYKFSQCPVCYRKYALPWIDHQSIFDDVYVISDNFTNTVNATKEYMMTWGSRQTSTS